VIRNVIKVLIADFVLLSSAFLVLQDLQVRAAYAASPHHACSQLCSYSPSFSYGLLTQFFTMDGNGQHLVSPSTLDWVQIVAVALVVANAWFAYAAILKRNDGETRGADQSIHERHPTGAPCQREPLATRHWVLRLAD